MWQDAVFLAGSVFSMFVLLPTLRDRMANVPLGTSVPSATIGMVYGGTFFTLGMTFSAAGSLLTGVMWALVAALRSPLQLDERLRLPGFVARGRAASEFSEFDD